MSQDNVNAFAYQLGGGIGGNFRFTDVIFDNQFHLFAQNTTFGIDIFYDQFGRFNGRNSVRCQVPAVRPSHAQLNGVRKAHAGYRKRHKQSRYRYNQYLSEMSFHHRFSS